MLHHRILPPERRIPGAPVLVLLHGRGSDDMDLQPLGQLLAPEATLVLPRAPYEAAPMGYGGGWAWYRFLGGSTPDPDQFEASQGALAALLGALPRLGADGPVVLGGFSQGGTMSLGHALRHPGTVAGVLNLSGFVPDHPTVRAETASGLRVFWGHGRADTNVPYALAEAGRAALAAAGADLTPADHAGGHQITQDELGAARAWIARVAAPEGRTA
ncbi:MAG TPA: alpha/beta hydrolase-fold protein [Gemmatimonadales bacterium]|nr:alpha/beta hydrolase-fold protein [Gemmatimonadales bacterium]